MILIIEETQLIIIVSLKWFLVRSKQIDFLTLFVQAADDTVEHIRQYKRALSEARSEST